MLSSRHFTLTAPLALFLSFGLGGLATGCTSANDTEETSSSSAANGGGATQGAGGAGGAVMTTSVGGGGAGGDAGQIDPGPADITANMRIINQRVYREDDAFAQGGTSQLEFYVPEPLPADDRTEFMTTDGERCTFESGTEWPYTLPGDATWPTGAFLNAGTVTLQATGAPGPVEYGFFDTYYLRNAPAPVQQGSFTHNSFYPPEYIPHGATATIEAAGGVDVGAFSVADVQLAADYVVSSPNLVGGGDLIDTSAPLTFSWSPPAPGDQMAVIVKDSFSFIKCVFDDDGEGTVPVEAMSSLNGGQFVRFTIQTWREHSETIRAESADGEQVDVEITSRHVQIGRFDAQ